MKNKLILLSAIILTGCGTRKTTIDKTTEKKKENIEIVSSEKETTDTKINTNVKETTRTEVDKQNNVVSEVTEITPIDPNKESAFTDAKGQKYNLNNSKYRNEKKTDLSKEKSVSLAEYNLLKKEFEKVVKIAETAIKENTELIKKGKTKDVISDKGFLPYWIILFIIAIVLFVLWSQKKVRDKVKEELL